MFVDYFEDEQRIYDEAVSCIESVKGGAPFDFEVYVKITKEYGRLLEQLRRSARITDIISVDEQENGLDLTDTVHYDTLTGIYNRRFMESNLKRVIKSLLRTCGELSILKADIDFFKEYTDTFGHSASEACLKSVAQAIAGSILRADDFAARYGDDEFIIVLPNTDESGARVMAKKILENIRALNIPHEKKEAANCVTVSIGAATGFVTNTQSEADYIKSADIALHESKQCGHNRYSLLILNEDE